jgi:hypothetical protein
MYAEELSVAYWRVHQQYLEQANEHRGTKLLTVATEHGKLSPADLARWEPRRGDEHHVQPRVVSITQATELGTVYTIEETRAIAAAAHDLGMLVHVDGARLANAAASLDASLGEITADAGVDLLSFGGTKNGLLLGDAVVFLRPGLSDGFEFVRKQLGQLASKMRFVAAQFEALLGRVGGAQLGRLGDRYHAGLDEVVVAAAALPTPDVVGGELAVLGGDGEQLRARDPLRRPALVDVHVRGLGAHHSLVGA